MAKQAYPGPTEALTRYEELVATVAGVERKGAKNPYTSLNGRMFSFLDAEGALALRLSPEDQVEFLESFDSGPVVQYGRTMQGYVAVPDTLWDDGGELARWFVRSHDWIATLKPKPTTRKR